VNWKPSTYKGCTELNESLFRKFIEAGADVNLVEWVDCDNESIHVLMAAGSGNTQLFQYLLELGVDLDLRLRSDYTVGEMALLRAIKADKLTMVHLLLSKTSILASGVLTQALQSLHLYLGGDWDVVASLVIPE
jgi:hypothetical protein